MGQGHRCQLELSQANWAYDHSIWSSVIWSLTTSPTSAPVPPSDTVDCHTVFYYIPLNASLSFLPPVHVPFLGPFTPFQFSFEPFNLKEFSSKRCFRIWEIYLLWIYSISWLNRCHNEWYLTRLIIISKSMKNIQ